MDDWVAAVKATASGYLGSTAGVTADRTFVALIRFESERAGRTNRDSPEEHAWWDEHMMPAIDGAASVIECADVASLYGGGSDDAGYVQVMSGQTENAARFKEISRRFEDYLPSSRPEIMGGITAFAADGRFFNVVYFTSREAARAGEKQPRPPEIEALFEEFDDPLDEYLDLTELWFDSA